MSAPKFSVGVDADPMLVEETIGKTLDEIIQERRKGKKDKEKPKPTRGTGDKSGKVKDKSRGANQVAKSVGTSRAKREALLAKKRGLSTSAKADQSRVEAEVQRNKKQLSKKKARAEATAAVASAKGVSKEKAIAKAKVQTKAAAAAAASKQGTRNRKKKGIGSPSGPKQSAATANGNRASNTGAKTKKPGRRASAGGMGTVNSAGAKKIIKSGLARGRSITVEAKGRDAKKKSGKRNNNKSAASAGGFSPDKNLKISFSSDAASTRPYIFGKPGNAGGSKNTRAGSKRVDGRSGNASSGRATVGSASHFNIGSSGTSASGRATYTPPVRDVVVGNGRVGRRRVAPKEDRRVYSRAADRVTSSHRARAGMLDARRSNRSGGEGRKSHDRRVILTGHTK